MIAASSISETKAIPSAPTGWFDYGYTALMDGRLALIRTRSDVHAEYRRLWAALNSQSPNLQPPTFWNDDVRLSVFDGEAETDVVAVPSGSYPIVDRMSDGRWVIVSSRAEEGEANARIYSREGAEEQAIALGDGIETLLCAPDGTIWVGYFDEGVFGGPNKDGSWPVSSGGIVQFDADGEPCWSFNEHVHNTRAVADSYAMTLSGGALWACYYTDFPIVRVEQGKATFWANDITGAKAIAVKDDVVVLAGGDGDESSRIAVARLERKAARHIGSLSFAPAPPGSAGMVQGRGSTMHLVTDGVWSKFSVHRAVQALQ